MHAPPPICTLPRRRVRQLCNTSVQFVHKPNTFDRDHIVVPAGWDSWGKDCGVRRAFDAKAWPEAWEGDLSSADAGILNRLGQQR